MAKVEEITKEEIDSGEDLIQNLIDITGQLVPENGIDSFNEFAMLMGLSEENFDILAPVIVDKFEASFKDTSAKYLLIKSLEQNNIDIHSLIDYQEELYAEIDKELTTIPQKKRDFLKQIIGIIINAASEVYGNGEDTVTIPIEICREGAVIPQYANIGDAGLDVVALEDITINPGETELVKTGLKVAIPKGYELQVRPRSGLSLKTKLRVANTPGTIKVA